MVMHVRGETIGRGTIDRREPPSLWDVATVNRFCSISAPLSWQLKFDLSLIATVLPAQKNLVHTQSSWSCLLLPPFFWLSLPASVCLVKPMAKVRIIVRDSPLCIPIPMLYIQYEYVRVLKSREPCFYGCLLLADDIVRCWPWEPNSSFIFSRIMPSFYYVICMKRLFNACWVCDVPCRENFQLVPTQSLNHRCHWYHLGRRYVISFCWVSFFCGHPWRCHLHFVMPCDGIP